MALTIVDLDAALVAGQARAQAWEAEWQAQFYGPLLLAEAVQAFLALPPAQQDALRTAEPEVWEQLRAQVARLRGQDGG